ncbi:MAG: Fe2+-dependent dioxygenase [Pseudomonadota bacterium]
MLLTISSVLDADTLDALPSLFEAVAWKDGRKTAGRTAAAVKDNTQADLTTRSGAKLRTLLRTAIGRHPVFRAAARPKRFSNLLVSKTRDFGGYGTHVDNAFMGEGTTRIRTDLSFTLFMSDPDSYQGGELSIDQAGLTQDIKLPRGDLILYPSTSLHRVCPVSDGERIVCVGWVQSSIRDGDLREILFDLENLKASLAGQLDPQSAEMLYLSKSMANLMRKFGD